MMSCKATSAFTSVRPCARPSVIRSVRCSAAVPAEPNQNMTRRSMGALLAGVPLLWISSGAAHADVGDAIKSLDPSVSTGSEPKIGDFGQAGPPGDVGKAIADGARGAQVPDPLKTVQDKTVGKASPFGGGPKVPTFGSGLGTDQSKTGAGGPANMKPGQNLAKNSIVEKALTDNSPAKQYNRK